jgi:hypothetical protein
LALNLPPLHDKPGYYNMTRHATLSLLMKTIISNQRESLMAIRAYAQSELRKKKNEISLAWRRNTGDDDAISAC